MDVDAVSVAVDGCGHQKCVHLPTLCSPATLATMSSVDTSADEDSACEEASVATSGALGSMDDLSAALPTNQAAAPPRRPTPP